MSHNDSPQTPPLRSSPYPNARAKPPHLFVVDTSLKAQEDESSNDQPCSPLSPVSTSPWEDASAASTEASIPSTPTTQVSVNDTLPSASFPLLLRDLPSSKPQPLSQSPPSETMEVKVPPESMGGPIKHIPPKWALRGDIYTFSFWTPPSAASSLPEHAYSPLEGKTSFADETLSRPVGGLSMIQILSYRDSPVGPYDEMLVAPGSFEWERTEPGGEKKKGCNPKITRIYVSTPNSCFNGRTNWNTPKHLAKFVWDHHPDGSTTIQIFPHDDPANPDESQPSSRPFFTTTFKPMSLVPRFPFATSWVDHLGFNTTLVMPPLPAGNGSYGELPATSRWISLVTKQYCASSSVGWYDVAQPDAGEACGGHENFLPWLGRWQVGLKMKDADLTFEIPDETWERGDVIGEASTPRAADEKTLTPQEQAALLRPRQWGSGNFLQDYFF
ncbi:hypothetical protein TrVFT333_009149 [Trichoderma virens FT-333]|nr:hypothetical protein TrVFT333_009149 [Trichoderma virens FT-333]